MKPTQRLDESNMLNSSEVTIVDTKMPFMSMIVFMAKLALAAIPAAIILAIRYAMLAGVLVGLTNQ
jgi:hypothetical protein